MSHSPPFLSRGWWRERATADLPASFVVFLVALPLSMGIAIASGVPVTAGLVTAIVGGLLAGALAGAPLQVSGPAAGLTVIVYQVVQQYGIEELGVVVLLAGGLQVLAGAFRIGQVFRAVSPAVVQGMLAGIGVLIVGSQFQVMIDEKPRANCIENILAIPQAVAKAIPWPPIPDSAEERSARTGLLKRTGLLHLQQAEIGEQVHHLLIGSEAFLPEEDDTVDSAPVVGDLRSLAPAQRLIVESLRDSPRDVPSDDLEHARRACREALADLEAGDIRSARASQDRAAQALADLRDALKSHRWAAGLGILTIVILVGWQKTLAHRWHFLPAPLVAVMAATLVTAGMELPVLYVEVPDDLMEEIFLPSVAEIKTLLTPGLVLVAVQIAVIASAETLLCATAVDQLHHGPRTRYDRELMAQGLGNMVCGMLSALPMTGVIVRSSANVRAGATSRWSAVLHGAWMLLFVAWLSFLLRLIPTASLAAILVYTGYKLVNPRTIKALSTFGKSEVAIYLGTMLAIVVTDLLTGVLFGIALSVGKLIYTFTRLRVKLLPETPPGAATLLLRGSATFLRLPRLAQVLERVPPGITLHVDLARLTYIDHACLDLLLTWRTQHEATGGQLVIDWKALTARFSERDVEESAISDFAFRK